jgi:hypothetical protein
MKRQCAPLAATALVILCLGGLLTELKTNLLRQAYDELVLDNRGHYLPCEELPADAEVRQALEDHPQVVRQVEAVNPGNVGFEIDPLTCPGRADLVIWYATHQNRLQIEEIINGDRFFGIPYRLQNR